MAYTSKYDSPIGRFLLVEKNGGLNELWINGQRYAPASDITETEEKETSLLLEVKNWLDRYFDGKKPSIDELTLTPDGGEFKQTVWKVLCSIPYGKTATYGEVAKKTAELLGKERIAAQAVGRAVGHNPISIIIPCHRVVGANGNLTGYARGIKTKLSLLQYEGADTSSMFIPHNKKGEDN